MGETSNLAIGKILKGKGVFWSHRHGESCMKHYLNHYFRSLVWVTNLRTGFLSQKMKGEKIEGLPQSLS